MSRIFINESYYHVYNRGVNKEVIFRNPDEYIYFLRRIKYYLEESGVELVCYALMPNHYHMILRQFREYAISKLLHRLSISYTQSINTKYERTGVLFQGRFKALRLDTEESVLHVCRYIHINPIKASLVDHLDKWPYSNWHEFVGQRSGILYSSDYLQILRDQKINYRQFVFEYIEDYQDRYIEPYIFNEDK